ncbi:ZN112-like protein, partial [Mya arenaria]
MAEVPVIPTYQNIMTMSFSNMMTIGHDQNTGNYGQSVECFDLATEKPENERTNVNVPILKNHSPSVDVSATNMTEFKRPNLDVNYTCMDDDYQVIGPSFQSSEGLELATCRGQGIVDEPISAACLHSEAVTTNGSEISNDSTCMPPKNPTVERKQDCQCNAVHDVASKEGTLLTCGSCLQKFTDILYLHVHMKSHGNGGSYSYDHVQSTAYPKKETNCSAVQTDWTMFSGRNESLEAAYDSDTDTQLGENIDILKNNENIYKRRKKHVKKKPGKVKNPSKVHVSEKKMKSKAHKIKVNESKLVKEREIKVEVNSCSEETVDNELHVDMSHNLKNDNLPDSTPDADDGVKVMKRKRGRPRKSDKIPCMLVNRPKKEKKISVPKDKKIKQKWRNQTEECSICKLFVKSHMMEIHLMKHRGEKPFICEVCGKSFEWKRFLMRHLLIHSEVKPWVCSVCKAQFCQKGDYKLHMAVHSARVLFTTTKRTFTWESPNTSVTSAIRDSSRKFKDKCGLRRHERIHTGEKQYECHVCGHAFIQSTPFWVHMETKHGLNKESAQKRLKDIQEMKKRLGIKTSISRLDDNQKFQGFSEGKELDTDVTETSGTEKPVVGYPPLNAPGAASRPDEQRYQDPNIHTHIDLQRNFSELALLKNSADKDPINVMREVNV